MFARNTLLPALLTPFVMIGCGVENESNISQVDQLSVVDPTGPGDYEVGTYRETIQVASTGNRFEVLCRLPTSGPSAGPFPVVLLAHGFQLSASQYLGYAERLASFGYVACSVDFPAGLFSPNHRRNAEDVMGALDWLIGAHATPGHALEGLVDADKVGLAGHSLGGKVSVLAAIWDSRVKAVLGLDPVDSATNCNATNCPDATDLLPLNVPLGLLGETLDARGGFFGQACAPASGNFQQFYAASPTNVLEIEVLGASHMSFLDNPGSCGFACFFCRSASTPHDQVLDIAYAVTVSFFERHLRSDDGYQTFLDGAEAQSRWVDTGLAAIQSR